MPRALILIDFINEFLHPDGKITPQGMGIFCTENGTIQNVQKLIAHFRATQQEIIWIRLSFHENYDNCSSISPRFKGAPALGILQEDTWSTKFLSELSYHPSEKTITKTRVSSFYKTELESYLKDRQISEIVVAGVATDLAVSSIARDAHDRDITCTVISDACATISREHHEAAIIGIAKLVSVKTLNNYLSEER